MTTENPDFAPLPHLFPVSSGLSDKELALSLAKAYLGKPNVQLGIDDLPKLFSSCLSAVTSGANTEPEEKVELKPAVSIRKSVGEDFIICLEDGKKFKSLKRHLRTHYNLTPEAYREKWGLPADYPMVAPSYSATRSKLAKDNGLGTKKD